MSLIEAKVEGADLRKLARLSRRFPRAVYKGMGRAGAVMRGKLRKVMRSGGGVEGVPKFAALDPVTLKARRAFGSRIRLIPPSVRHPYGTRQLNASSVLSR